MPDKLLITINDIKEYSPMAELSSIRVDSHIREAQMNDLKPFLGEPLYRDLITNTDTTANQELLKGKTYKGIEGYNIDYNGLIPILVYYSLARIVANNQINITSYGVVRKKVDESDAVDAASLRFYITEKRSIATRYQKEAHDFLVQNIATYPLWQFNKVSENIKTGLNIFKV